MLLYHDNSEKKIRFFKIARSSRCWYIIGKESTILNFFFNYFYYPLSSSTHAPEKSLEKQKCRVMFMKILGGDMKVKHVIEILLQQN